MTKAQVKKQAYIRRNVPLTLMALPAIALVIAFKYVPFFGLVLGFKDFSYRAGIWDSPWVGLDNFKYIFDSGEIWRTIGNTIYFHIGTTALVTVSGIILATLLYFVNSKKATNAFQISMIIPFMVSYTVIAFVVYILLKNDGGLLNHLLTFFGGKSVSWYTQPKYWRSIILMVQMWFGAGVKSVYYYATLMAIDQSLFEAAEIDGANRWHKIFHIMMPALGPTVALFLIMDTGGLLQSDMALFYSVPMDSSALYPVTDVLSTYTYRGLVSGDIGTTTALGLFTGVVTTVTILLVNRIVKKISPGSEIM